MEDFSVAAREDFVGIDRSDFFTQGERAQLVQSELDFIRVGGDDETEGARHSRELDALGVEHDHGGINTLRHVLEANGLVDCVAPLHDETEREELMWKVRVACAHAMGGGLIFKDAMLFSDTRQDKTRQDKTHTRARAHTHTHTRTHVRAHTHAHARTHTHIQTMKFAMDDTLFSPVQELRDYYGEEVAFYYVWMDFLTCWLCVPAAVSAVLYV
jgi:hypothetical protein